jgi:hypothetical protein
MEVTYKHYYKVMQISKGTIYFSIYHHNVRELGKKACELLSHLHPDFPHVLCLTEHHLKYPQLNNDNIKNYNLGTYYCRQLHEEGAVAIFVLNSLCVSNIDIVKHCEEQDISVLFVILFSLFTDILI